MLAAPMVTWSLMRPSQPIPISTRLADRLPAPVSVAAATLTVMAAPVRGSVAATRSGQFLPWVVVIWLVGAMVFWVRLVGGWMVAARMRRMLVWPAPPEWQQTLKHLQARIRVSRPVRLLVSALVQVPTVVGWLRPVVLVPVGALAGLTPEHVEALLLHELAHIRRQDYLVNILQSVAEALLFYHPAVWWVSGHIRNERELCCDDIAVSASGGDVFTYACALAELESSRPAHFEAAVAANGGSLADRIARLLGQSRPGSRTLSGPGILASAVLLIVTVCAVFGQSDATPKFEVASVKLNPDRSIRFMRVSPRPGGSLVTENAPLRLLIQNAYSVQEFQILGGPGWIQSDGYNIDAKGTGNASREQIFVMLRSLLEDRFLLKIHRETKELPVYALTVAKNGPKLPQPKEGGCIAVDPNAPPAQRRPAPGPGRSTLFPCGGVGVMAEPFGARLQGAKIPMAEFIRTLSMVMGRPVVDKTGFAELFDLLLDFSPDEATAGLPRGGAPRDAGSTAAAPDPAAPPSIFAAIQEQLGLKLESTKGPVEVLVIDHVERPSEN